MAIQFRSGDGQVNLSIPSQRQLDAYAAHPLAAPPGQEPVVT